MTNSIARRESPGESDTRLGHRATKAVRPGIDRAPAAPRPARLRSIPEIRFSARFAPSELDMFLSALRTTVGRLGYVLIRDAGFGRSALRTLLHAVAEPERLAGTDLLARLAVAGTPPALPVPAHVPALPLHRDAVLIGAPTRLIGFSALDTDHTVEGGALELVDSVAALAEFPPDLLDTLLAHDLEYRVRDCSPFPNIPSGWFARPTFEHTRAGRGLGIVLPPAAPPGAAPWETRLRGLGARASAQTLGRIDELLRRSASYRTHAWSTGDAIVVDNSRVLHGITAVRAATRHHVIRESL